ncbi:MAG TPA: outer membrane lipoprotein carrier protein LolA [Bryobacteraceae bacterium]|nr:outer membrane lipoprotein carrier protein LolA [Bryobacteraceae bacterium]
MSRWFALAALALGSIRMLAAEPVDDLIARMQKHYNSARTLSLQFEESYSILGHARPPEAGTLTLRKQGKMRWEYTRPSGKLFISDGKNVFLYTPADNRVEKIPLKDTEDMRAPMAFLLGHLDMKKEFRDFRSQERPDGTWIEAAAKNDHVPYLKVEMLLQANGTVERLKIFGRDQSELSFKFTNEKVDPAVPDGLFHFEIPPGAEVVDSVEFGAEGN